MVSGFDGFFDVELQLTTPSIASTKAVLRTKWKA
jgi:hypothetical protein